MVSCCSSSPTRRCGVVQCAIPPVWRRSTRPTSRSICGLRAMRPISTSARNAAVAKQVRGLLKKGKRGQDLLGVVNKTNPLALELDGGTYSADQKAFLNGIAATGLTSRSACRWSGGHCRCERDHSADAQDIGRDPWLGHGCLSGFAGEGLGILGIARQVCRERRSQRSLFHQVIGNRERVQRPHAVLLLGSMAVALMGCGPAVDQEDPALAPSL